MKVSERLERLGVEVYCPVVKEVRQWSDRKKKVTVPLFNSYLFVQVEKTNVSLIYEASGVLGYLNWLGKPALVRDSEIQTIKNWLDKEGIDEVKVAQLQEGDRLQLKNGQFQGKEAIIEEIGSKKLQLILPEMGWKVTANIQDVL
ncbi:UpxY family transcription antiterminator [Christiangramia flava]|uniref:UpxY family transcription antiterminator n=1 Tax=Christiangramia flava TaxID=1486245 RepID=UPI0009F9D9F2|nr:UpxY family transcription antiterminator [Christiangramia flava]